MHNTQSYYILARFRTAVTTSSGIRATCCSPVKKRKEEDPNSKKKETRSISPKTNMASTSEIGIEIRKFDGKNIALWKEMMQDVLIIRRQVEAIRHSEKPTLMTIEEWKSIDEITRSTIRIHLAENVQ